MEEFLEKLRCPQCRGDLRAERIESTAGEQARGVKGARCVSSCSGFYPIRDGVLELTTPDLQYSNDAPATGSPQLSQREHFDKWARSGAQTYDDFMRQPCMQGTIATVYPRFTRRIRKDGWLLDIGCGTGKFSLAMAAQGARVVAFDISRELVAQAAREAENRGLSERVLFFVADGDEPPVKDGSFDFASTMGVLHHLPDPQKACVSIQRALRAGGIHFFSENNDSLLRPIFDWMMRIAPLWDEEAGEEPLLSASKIRSWHRGIDVSFDFFYSVFIPPHLANAMGGRIGKSMVIATDVVFNAIPGICRLGGLIHGVVEKSADASSRPVADKPEAI